MYLVFDIGGTFTRHAVIRNRKLIEINKNKTIKNNKLLNYLEDITISLLRKYKIRKFKGIGISAPGALCCERLELTAPTNTPYIKNLKLIPLKKYTKKLVLENDANCAALGAQVFEKQKNIVCLTLGTGVGCGLIINNQLYKGKGSASEFGHTIVNIDKINKSSINNSTLEDYISVRGLINIAKKYNLNKNGFELQELAAKGNQTALKVYKKYGKYLSTALVNIANTFDPDVIVLTGGLTHASQYFLNTAKQEAKKSFFPGIKPEIKIYKQNLSLLGAFKLVK
ncbi:MAG: ROK family protein [archaeon]